MKIIKYLLILLISLGSGALVYFTSNDEALIVNQEFLVNISFIIFGFLLTLFSLLIIPIRKISIAKGYETTRHFVKSLRDNLLYSFFQTISIFILNYVINIKLNIPMVLISISSILIISSFVLLMFVLFDTMIGFFLIIQVETSASDES